MNHSQATPHTLTAGAGVTTAIVLFVALLIGAIWISALEIAHVDRDETISVAIERNDNLAIALEEYTVRTIESADAVMKYMIREFVRNSGKVDLEKFAAEHAIDNNTFSGIVMTDEKGNVVTTAYLGGPDKPVNIADREHFRAHLAQRINNVFVGKPVQERISGSTMVPITRRISKPDGSFAGVAMVLIEHPRFTDVLRDAKMRQLDIISLIGFDGITRARLRGTTPTAGEDISKSPLFAEHARNPVGHYAAHGQVDGVKRMFSYRSLPEYQLIASVGAAEAEVLAGFHYRQQQYFRTAGVASILIAGFSLLLIVSLEKQRRAAASVVRSQARFLATFNQAAVGIAHGDLDGRCLEANQKLCDITGYAREELLGRKFSDITHPEDVEASRQLMLQLNKESNTSNSLQQEKRYIRKDGSVVWCLLNLSVVRDNGGNIDYLAAVIQDINDQKKAEQERAQLAAIVESSSDAIISRTPDRTINSWNRAAELMFGWTADEAIGQSVRIITPPEQTGLLEPLVERVMLGEIVAPVDAWRMRRDGSRFEAQIGFSAINGSDGKITAIATIIRDITERREKEEIVLKEKLFSDAMIESMPGIVYFYNEQGRFLRWNRNFSRVSGYSPEEIATMHPLDFFRNEEKPLLERKIREVFVRGEASVEAELLAKDGRTTQYFFTGKRVTFDGSTCLVGMGIDISERKLAEAALRDHAAQMRHLSWRLSEVEERERRDIHRELHDRVGANLAALKLDLGLINSMLSTDGRETIGDRLQRAQQLTGETVAQIRDVMGNLRPPALDDYGLLAALRNCAQPHSVRLGIPVTVDGDDIQPRLAIAVETALFRIVQEALTNIAKHARASHVTITLNTSADRVALIVADDGKGFDAVRPGSQHGGWGLRTMRERAQAIAADFRIESSPGNGTRIIVELPRENA